MTNAPRKGSKYTPEIVRFIKENVKKTKSDFELTELVNKEFGTAFDYEQLRTAKQKNKIKRGEHWRKKPVLSERLNCEGYTLVKVSDEGKSWQQWRLKHILLWEQANGKAPKGHRVIFLDGNKSNVALDNLACIPCNVYNSMLKNNLHYNNSELTKTGILIARHKIAIIECLTRGTDEKEKKSRLKKFYKQQRKKPTAKRKAV
jgi:hypothetical protein